MTLLSLLKSMELPPIAAVLVVTAAISLFVTAHTDWLLRTMSRWK